MSLATVSEVVGVLGVAGVVVVHTLVAAVAVRFFRLRLSTRLGWVLYSLLAIPVVYVASALLFLGVLGIGRTLTVDRGTLLAVVWGLPLALGVSLDLFWVPQPEEIEGQQGG